MNKEQWHSKWEGLIEYGELPYMMKELDVSRYTLNRILSGKVRADMVKKVDKLHKHLIKIKIKRK
jgi:hypothetical protein